MKNLTFDVHTYAPELNTIYSNGKNITRMIPDSVVKGLSKDHGYNVRLVRKSVKPNKFLRTWRLIATRPNGTTETRFCRQTDINGILHNFKQAKTYYNVVGTRLEYKPYFNY